MTYSRFSILIFLSLILSIAGCSQIVTKSSLAQQIDTSYYHPVILVSIDGFRPDYLHRGVTPNLNKLIANGVSADAMRPSFPSITFPNHYTLVTGLRPDHHGIVGNTMEDTQIPDVRFTLSNRDAVTDRRWWDQAEPVWVTAEKKGIKTGIMFWPGSEAAIHGVLPTDFRRFDGKIAPAGRVDTMLTWLDKPVGDRPGFLTVYFDDVDHAGHEFGPDTAQVTSDVARVDHAIGQLVDGLRVRHIDANVVIVSDHGMAATSADRIIRLNELADPASYRLITSGTYAGIDVNPGQEALVATALLKKHEHMQCWKKEAIPQRFHYGQNARVPRFICLADVGWLVEPGDKNGKTTVSGSHGYDNLAPEMQALFIATGPAFKQATVLPAFDNVDVYPLLMELLDVPALPSDGSMAIVRQALKAK
ncbi:ectonucleotide pyrophosphatase/phosphodiesterase [Undibacterium sp. RuTC16W]|uniref:alkaline phosphatase family protein n=1 Tax=Undibacterium sp. RuTC16W TaxID=3413048 RepID=UPI003BF4163D